MRIQFVRLLQKSINISLSKQEVYCHMKQTISMADVYLNDAVVFEGPRVLRRMGSQCVL